MDAMWVIYLGGMLGKLSNLIGFLIVLIILGLIVGTFITSIVFQYDDDAPEKLKAYVRKWWAWTKWPIVFCFVVGTVAPEEKTFYMMAAAKVGQNIVESPSTKELSGKVLQLLNKKLDEQIGTKK